MGGELRGANAARADFRVNPRTTVADLDAIMLKAIGKLIIATLAALGGLEKTQLRTNKSYCITQLAAHGTHHMTLA